MPDIYWPAVGVAAIAAFVASGAWYAATGRVLARHRADGVGTRPAGATAAVELVRNVVLAVVTAGIAAAIGVDGFGPALLLAVALWVGFPVVILAGSVFHERVPAALASVHIGDWLVKLVLVTVIVGIWN